MSKTSHAKIFDVRGHQVLVYLDHDEDRDNLLVMRFRLWSDAVAGPAQITPSIGGEAELSPETIELWETNTRNAFDEITVERVEKVLEKMDIFSLLEKLDEDSKATAN